MPLEADPRETYDATTVPSAETRRPVLGHYETTLAMHWDGTYRDRIRGAKWEFWTEKDYNSGDRPWPASSFAKHLESREETDHRLGYLSDNQRELLSDLQNQQF